ncbi:hypothetical protein CEV33_1650 [Brucella grignonensis]|uniref:Uncharacterized protein n=1 Tax=Brucella grignonensis TaxID=94627 RepID=A0A256F9J3_9HYPH|nr:hypothetical protein CEV33_1650 [Brucella grignonensis]
MIVDSPDFNANSSCVNPKYFLAVLRRSPKLRAVVVVERVLVIHI